MADDNTFDPLGGIVTPQALQLQRPALMSRLYQEAGLQGGAIGGLMGGARVAGLALGQDLAQAGSGGPLDQIAAQNQAILAAPVPSQALAAPGPNGGGVGVLELTRFRGHLNVRFGGVHDGKNDNPVHPGV